MAKILFYDTTEIDNKQLSDALSSTDHTWKFNKGKITLENLDPSAEVISVFVGDEVTREIIEAMPNLKIIACRSTGYDHIDLEAAREKDIAVLTVPSYGNETVAEYSITLLLMLSRSIAQTINVVEEDQLDPANTTGFDLHGKTIGIIGTGRIGSCLAKLAHGFGMKVIAYDSKVNQELVEETGCEYYDLDELASRSDVISLHAPLLPSTHHIISEDFIDNLKHGAVIINTSRGELIDTSALINGLLSGKVGGAGLDVIENEHLLQHEAQLEAFRENDKEKLDFLGKLHLLRALDNVIIMPHNAYNTVEARQRINNTTASNIIDFWYGKTPNIVKPREEEKSGRLIIIRHAESEWNALGKWTGVTDISLSDTGFEQAQEFGKTIADIKIDEAYCSEQSRSAQTLREILSVIEQTPPTSTSGAINERDYGEYTGLNKFEIRDKIGENAFNKIRRGWNEPIPGGETLKDVYQRAVPFFEEVLLPKLINEETILLVAHGNSLRALIKYLEDISDEDIANVEMPFGKFKIYDFNNSGKVARITERQAKV